MAKGARLHTWQVTVFVGCGVPTLTLGHRRPQAIRPGKLDPRQNHEGLHSRFPPAGYERQNVELRGAGLGTRPPVVLILTSRASAGPVHSFA